MKKRKIILLIADGWGIAKPGKGNYIEQSNKPNFDSYIKNYPHTKNKASGIAVGLPKGLQGNSEVGHLHLGAGRIIWQMDEIIKRSIKDKTFFENKEIIKSLDNVLKNKSNLHLMGLCSDEGVHAHTDHLKALLKMAKKKGISNIFIHFFADGRDVPEKSAVKYVETIEKLGIGKIISVLGRFYSMDRDNNWDRTKKAYDLITKGIGHKSKTAISAIKSAYKRGEKTDYYIEPTVIEGFQPILDNDSVIFFNFRTDRPRQLTECFIKKSFNKFKRGKVPKTYFLTMSNYKKDYPCHSVFEEEKIKNNLGEILSSKGYKQLRMAETEKYAHVTYFFNSQNETPLKGEKRIMIPSPKVPSYDLKPEMSAKEISSEAVKQIKTKKHDFIVMNFANCDLVGHSAVKKAIIECVSVVDDCTNEVVEAGLKEGYTILLTADHGSAEEKLYPNGKPKPAHSSNPVNFIVISNDSDLKGIKLKSGGQSDVAPTILDLFGLKQPKDMTGNSLIYRK